MKQLISILTMLFLCVYVNAQVGSLDGSFNTTGYSRNVLSAQDDYGSSMAVQSDGKVVVAVVVTEEFFKIVRYETDGTLDAGFGTNGIVTIRQNPIKTAQSHAIALQSDGKIIVGGYTWTNDNNDFAIVRLNTDGSVDTNFGTNGWVFTAISPITAPPPSGDDQIRSLAILPDNSIIAAGYAFNGVDDDFAIAKYSANGVLETSFGTNGIIIVDIKNTDFITSMAVTNDGKIVVVGNSNWSTDTDISIAVFTAGGTPDPAFNGGAVLTTGVTGNYEVYSVAVQTNGNIVFTGLAPANFGTKDAYVARLLPNGTFDPGFNSGAPLTVNLSPTPLSNDEGRTVLVQNDGKIIIVGHTDAISGPSVYDILLVRLNSDGTLDTSYDGDGIAVANVSTESDFSRAATFNGNRLYVAGSVDYTVSGTRNTFLAAFENDFTVLPIVLSDFFAQKLTSTVSLKWQTSSEENVKRFVIERSSDGKTYKAIGTVAAVGNSTIKQSYNFVDNSPFIPATNFYRLLMQDADGKFKYSKILSVKYTGTLSVDIQLSPNPTSSMLQIQLPDGLKGNISLQVLDMSGRTVKIQNLSSDGHALSTSIDVNGLQSGVYILKAQSGSTSITSRFIKK